MMNNIKKKKAPTKMYPIGTALLRSNVIYWEAMETTWKDSWEHFRVEYTHHQLTVNAMFPNMTISENTTFNKTSLGKLLEDV